MSKKKKANQGDAPDWWNEVSERTYVLVMRGSGPEIVHREMSGALRFAMWGAVERGFWQPDVELEVFEPAEFAPALAAIEVVKAQKRARLRAIDREEASERSAAAGRR